MSRDEDGLIAQRGQLAGLLRAEVGARIERRMARIIDELVMRHRGADLTDAHARASVAALAELKGFLADLDRELRQAAEARERLMTAVPDS